MKIHQYLNIFFLLVVVVITNHHLLLLQRECLGSSPVRAAIFLYTLFSIIVIFNVGKVSYAFQGSRSYVFFIRLKKNLFLLGGIKVGLLYAQCISISDRP